MIIPQTKIQQLDDEVDAEETDFDAPDVYQFWGMVQGPGEVCPVNIDHCVYYTPQSVIQSPDVTGTPIRVDHTTLPDNEEASNIGVVQAEAMVDDVKFTLNEITRDGWEGFVQAVEDENGNISLTYNQLVREIHAGNLALSAGLGVAQVQTPIHDHTVSRITQWDEVSIVGKPAVPGSWAWACEGSCEIVFGEQRMSQKSLNIDLEALQQKAEEGNDGASQLVEVLDSDDWGDEVRGLQMTPEGHVTLIEDEDELHQSECTCNSDDLKQKVRDLQQQVDEVQSERDTYKEALEDIQQAQKDNAGERLREINSELPEDEQYAEQELEELIEESTPKHLNQTADMLERVFSISATETEAQQGKEDLSGTSGTSNQEEELEKAKQEVDSVSQELFGNDLESVLDEIEQGRWGN